jgi:hypothetical protein
MRTKTNGLRRLSSSHKKISPAIFALVILLALTLSACGSNADATPTISVEAIYTSAVQTFTAQQATQLALTPPTPLPSATPFPTLPPVPTFASGSILGSTTTSAAGGATSSNSSVYVSDVTIPDGTVLDSGKKFVKTWALMNKGTCAWSTSYKIAQVGGDDMGGAPTAITSSVPAGNQIQVSVNLTAPTKAGNYTGSWQMQNDQGQFFGNVVTVVIKVGAAATDTPGADTATPGTPTP